MEKLRAGFKAKREKSKKQLHNGSITHLEMQ